MVKVLFVSGLLKNTFCLHSPPYGYYAHLSTSSVPCSNTHGTHTECTEVACKNSSYLWPLQEDTRYTQYNIRKKEEEKNFVYWILYVQKYNIFWSNRIIWISLKSLIFHHISISIIYLRFFTGQLMKINNTFSVCNYRMKTERRKFCLLLFIEHKTVVHHHL